MKPYTGQKATVMLKHEDRQNYWHYTNKHNYNKVLRVLFFAVLTVLSIRLLVKSDTNSEKLTTTSRKQNTLLRLV